MKLQSGNTDDITWAKIDRREYQIDESSIVVNFLAWEPEHYLSDAHVKVLVVDSAGDGMNPVQMRLRHAQLRGLVRLLIWGHFRRSLQARHQADGSCPASMLNRAQNKIIRRLLHIYPNIFFLRNKLIWICFREKLLSDHVSPLTAISSSWNLESSSAVQEEFLILWGRCLGKEPWVEHTLTEWWLVTGNVFLVVWCVRR